MHTWISRNILSGRRPYLVILILGVLLYFQTLFFDFSYLDDNTLILDNQYFLNDLSNVLQSFRTDVFHLFNHSATYYRPLLTISLMLDYQLGGITPFVYHLTNVLLHLLAACLALAFFLRLGFKRDLSLLAAVIFLVHPVLTQAVAWVPGRNDSLLAVFLLSFFLFFLRYLETGQKKFLGGCLAFFTAALFTKETALFSVPLVAFFLYFVQKERTDKFNAVHFFSWLLSLAGLWFLLRHFALQSSSSMSLPDMLKSVFVNLPALVQFIGKIFFPFNLSVLPIIQDTTFVYGIIAIGLTLLLIFFTKDKRWNFIFFGLGWFFIFLLPSFIRPNPALVADFIEHRLYVPLIGFLILIMETEIAKRFDYRKISNLIWAGVLVIMFFSLAAGHSRNFADRMAFWKNAVAHSPHYPLAHRNLGAMYYLEGKLDEAEKEFIQALELNPEEEMCHNNLGLIYLARKDFARSEAEFNAELKINPFYDNAYFNRGLLYYNMGKREEAQADWKKTLEINPGYVDALYNLAASNYDQKNFAEATVYAKKIMERDLPLQPELQKLLQPINSPVFLNNNLK